MHEGIVFVNKIVTWIQLNAESTFSWDSHQGENSTEVLCFFSLLCIKATL